MSFSELLESFGRRRCLTKTSEAPPTPAAAKAVVKRVQRLRVVGCCHRYVAGLVRVAPRWPTNGEAHESCQRSKLIVAGAFPRAILTNHSIATGGNSLGF